MQKANIWRWLFFFTGIMVIGLGIALTVKGQRFGVGSWDVLHIGLYNHFGLSIGAWSDIAGITIITISSIGLRQFPKIATFLNMIFIGVFIDFFNWLLPDVHAISFQFMDFILGVILIAVGGGIYISANLGAGPRDSLMLLAVEKFHCSITLARTIMEIVVAFAGYLLGGPVGIGTIIMVFALGPIVQLSLGVCRKLLMKCIGDEQVAFF
ncbi:YitT family protein [Rummeliibacillus sp. NPDC094406]|uniref:YczE/YyaS/YitT family protein n=1 Tax=Rummeliibacillus sp. NPDC094406 TaxID=3364511 RepID=UPI003830CCA7